MSYDAFAFSLALALVIGVNFGLMFKYHFLDKYLILKCSYGVLVSREHHAAWLRAEREIDALRKSLVFYQNNQVKTEKIKYGTNGNSVGQLRLDFANVPRDNWVTRQVVKRTPVMDKDNVQTGVRETTYEIRMKRDDAVAWEKQLVPVARRNGKRWTGYEWVETPDKNDYIISDDWRADMSVWTYPEGSPIFQQRKVNERII